MSRKKSHSDIGYRLKSIRKTEKLTQHAFASLLGIKQSWLSELESGIKQPSDVLLAAIQYRFNIDRDWILAGKGWTYTPSTSAQAFDWLKKQLEQSNVIRVLIVTYQDNKFGWANGFVLETNKGVLSMEGGSTRSGYTGGGPTTYKEILLLLKEKGIPTDGLSYEGDENTPTLSQIDLSSLLSHQHIRKDVIDVELKSLSGALPIPSEAKGKEVSWTIPIIVRVTDLSGLSEEEATGEITKMETLYNTAYLPKRVQIFTGKPDIN